MYNITVLYGKNMSSSKSTPRTSCTSASSMSRTGVFISPVPASRRLADIVQSLTFDARNADAACINLRSCNMTKFER